MTAAARILLGHKRIYSGWQGLYAGRRRSSTVVDGFSDFGFHAPLIEYVFLDKGVGAASFTRATTKTVVDFEGCIKNALSGEVTFGGQRRVHNIIGGSSENLSNASWVVDAGATVTHGHSDPTGGAGATKVVGSAATKGFYNNPGAAYSGVQKRWRVWLKGESGGEVVEVGYNTTVTLTTSWQLFSTIGLATDDQYMRLRTSGAAYTFYVFRPMGEVVTGQSNQNPSEYVSVGAPKLNELRESSGLGTTPWALTNVTVSNGTTPSFSVLMQNVKATASAVTSLLQEWTATSTSYCYTIYGKKDTGASDCNCFRFRNTTTATDLAVLTINWDTGVITHTVGSGATATDMGGGIWRITVPISSGITVGNTLRIYAGFKADSETANEAAYLGGAQVTPGTTAATAHFPVGNVYPYHGACVDGVKYFSTLNGNTVASNIVTEATGAALPRPQTDGLTNGLVLSGAASNYASTPDASPLDVAGDIDLIAKIAPVDWTPSVEVSIISKFLVSGNQRSWLFAIDTAGALRFYQSLDGVSATNTSSSVATGASDGSMLWVRVTRESSTGAVKFYTGGSGATPSWVQLGVDRTLASGALYNSTATLQVGVYGATNQPFSGTIYRAIVKDGIDGTTVFDADFTSVRLGALSFTESSSNAATVTINQSGGSGAYIGNPARVASEAGYCSDAAATNICLQSSNFGTTWTDLGTPTRSAAAAYCGEVALDLLGDDNAAGLEAKLQAITFTGDATKSVSFLVKAGTSTSSVVQLYDNTAPANRLIVAITWANGLPVCTYTTGSEERPPEALANGCFRIFCLTSSVTAANSHSIYFYPATTTAFAAANTGNCYFGGVQVQNATVASPNHIPTTTGSVTVNLDFLRWPAAGNCTNGTLSLYGESFVPAFAGVGRVVDVHDTGDVSLFTAVQSATAMSSGGPATYSDSTAVGGVSVRAWQKVAAALTTNDANKAVNGVPGTLDTTVTPTGAAVTSIIAGAANSSANLNGRVRNIRVAATRVSDANLDLVTTP